MQDALVYRLAGKLGGRDAVMDLPLVEALTYLIIMLEEEEEEARREEVRFFMEHMSRMHSRPPQDEESAKSSQNFIESITPEAMKKAPELALEWDFESLENVED